MEYEVTTATLPNEWSPKPSVIAQLAAFTSTVQKKSWPNNLWLTDDRMEVYIRYARRSLPYRGDHMTFKCLDIGNVTVFDTGQGVFSTRFLPQAIKLNPWDAVYVENVLSDRFANYFRKLGWIEIPCISPSFFLVKN